ncbi:MAG: DUF2029 domain-containing protein [Bdellovibrio sp.]|nr:DUF2029 domain-containing protein [Bdellovibrio sp.]
MGKPKARLILNFFFAALLVSMATWFITKNTHSIYCSGCASHKIKLPDFVSSYIAAKIAIEGNADKIYDLDLQQKYNSHFAQTHLEKILPYYYPPHSLVFFAPAVTLPTEKAYHIWQWLTALTTLFLLALLYYAEICHNQFSFLIATCLTIIFFPWVASMMNGQPTLIMTVGLLGGYLFAQHRRYLATATILIITAFKPQMAMIPALYLLILYGKRMWISMIAVTLVILTICSVIFGINIWQSYIHSLLTAPYSLRQFEPIHLHMTNMRAILLLIFDKQYFALINIVSLCLWGIGLVAVGIMAWIGRQKTQKLQDFGFSLAIVLSCIFCPYLFIVSLTLLIIPIGYCIQYGSRKTFYLAIMAILILDWISLEHWDLSPYAWVAAQLCLLAWMSYSFLKEKKLSNAFDTKNKGKDLSLLIH